LAKATFAAIKLLRRRLFILCNIQNTFKKRRRSMCFETTGSGKNNKVAV